MPVLSARFRSSQGLPRLIRAAAEHANHPLLILSGLSGAGDIERSTVVVQRALPHIPILCLTRSDQQPAQGPTEPLLFLIDEGPYSLLHCPARGDLLAGPAIESLTHFVEEAKERHTSPSYLLLSALPTAKSEALLDGLRAQGNPSTLSALHGGTDAWIANNGLPARGGFLVAAFAEPLYCPALAAVAEQSKPLYSHALDSQRAFYRTVLEEMSAGLTLLDPCGVTLYESPASTRLHGQSSSLVIGKAWAEAVLEAADAQTVQRALYGLIGNPGQSVSMEAHLKTQGDTPKAIQLNIRNCLHMPEVRAMVCSFKDISALKTVERQLRKLATTDELTGLANRRQFLSLAQHEIARTIRHQRPLSLLMIDIDFFKSVNDRFGHPVGDEVLRHLGAICTETLRQEEITARLGGEEFAVLMPETDLAGARLVAERLRQAVSSRHIPSLAGKHALTASFGISQFNGVSDSLEAMFARADEALYAAKRNGRNRVEVASLAACVA